MMVVVVLIFGLIFGGWFIDNFFWLWIFYINLLVGLVVVVIIWVLLYKCEIKIFNMLIDVIGLVLLVVGVGVL